MVVNNLLMIHELIYCIRIFIPLYTWDRDNTRFYRFTPKDLLSCIQVNHAWYAALVPLLWMVYSNMEMG